MDFKQGISKQITKLNIKTSSFLEETKIKTFITTLENDIKELKANAGELSYSMWAEGNFEESRLIQIFEEISGKYQMIREQEQQLQALEEQNRQVLGQAAAAAAGGQEMVFCPNCGESYPGNVNFCTKCGTKLH